MIIRKKQFTAFSDYLMSSFLKKALLHIKQKFPVSTQGKTDEKLNQVIIDGIEKSSRYNILEAKDVLPFIEYMICLGEGFDENDEHSWAIKILKIRNLPGPEKISRLNKIMLLKPEMTDGYQNQ